VISTENEMEKTHSYITNKEDTANHEDHGCTVGVLTVKVAGYRAKHERLKINPGCDCGILWILILHHYMRGKKHDMMIWAVHDLLQVRNERCPMNSLECTRWKRR
jgi:hypothetical protein